ERQRARLVVDLHDARGTALADADHVAERHAEAVGEIRRILDRDDFARAARTRVRERNRGVDAGASRLQREVLRLLRIRRGEDRLGLDIAAEMRVEALLRLGEVERGTDAAQLDRRVVPRALGDQIAFDDRLAHFAGRIRLEPKQEIALGNARIAAVAVDDVVLEDVAGHAFAAFVEHESPGRAAVTVEGVVINPVVSRDLRAAAALGRDAFLAVRVDEIAPDDIALALGLHPRVARHVGGAPGVADDVFLEEIAPAHQRQVASADALARDRGPVVVEDVAADHVALALDLKQVVRAARHDVALEQIAARAGVDLDAVAVVLAVLVPIHADEVDDVVHQLVVVRALADADAVPAVRVAERRARGGVVAALLDLDEMLHARVRVALDAVDVHAFDPDMRAVAEVDRDLEPPRLVGCQHRFAVAVGPIANRRLRRAAPLRADGVVDVFSAE